MLGLTLSFKSDNRGAVDLLATLDVHGFHGEIQALPSPWEVPYLIKALGIYPISVADPIGIVLADSVSIAISPFGKTGVLEVEASVFDSIDIRNRCGAVFHCHYADIDRFRRQLEIMATEGTGIATLVAS